MKVRIRKISIKRFRSFGQVDIDASQLNIYTGKNNAGKSNILRALNLFFNLQSNYGVSYNHVDDYNKSFRGATGGQRAIRIELTFAGTGEAALKDDFTICKTFLEGIIAPTTEYGSTNSRIDELIKAGDGNVIRQFTTFFNKIEYLYIPAVRDKVFVRSLLLRFEQVIKSAAKGEDFNESIKSLSKILNEVSTGVSRNFQRYMKMPAVASLSSDVTDVLGAIEINVNSGLQVQDKKKEDGKNRIRDIPISLFSSGDGIVMAYLVSFLAFLTKEDKKNFIWGFEEPENSLEYSKVEELAEQFYDDFSKSAQIFITTHSPAFINLCERKGTSLYRVYTEPQPPSDVKRGLPNKCLTRVEKLDSIKQRLSLLDLSDPRYTILDEELHMAEQSKAIERIARSVREDREQLMREKAQFQKKYKDILSSFPKKIFICEDGTSIELWQHLLAEVGVMDVTVMSSDGCDNSQIETWALRQKKIKLDYNPKIFREIDRDGMLDEQTAAIKNQAEKKFAKNFNYVFEPLPVCEIENFALLHTDNREKLPSTYNELETSSALAISDHFMNTIRSKMHSMLRYTGMEEHFPKLTSTTESNNKMSNMRETAKADFVRLMPGKELSNLINNFDPCTFLQRLRLNDFPEELKTYVEKIKDFFSDDSNIEQIEI